MMLSIDQVLEKLSHVPATLTTSHVKNQAGFDLWTVSIEDKQNDILVSGSTPLGFSGSISLVAAAYNDAYVRYTKALESKTKHFNAMLDKVAGPR